MFSWVATVAHFALLRDDGAPLQSAPVIKLPSNASDEDFFGLLTLLNSSTACFWLKQYSQSKGAPRVEQLRAEEEWERIYEFTSTCLLNLPIPGSLATGRGAELDLLVRRLAALQPGEVCRESLPTQQHLDRAPDEEGSVRGRMVALQEELDWDVYCHYGLVTESEAAGLLADPDAIPTINPGERAFEIILARRMASGETQTQWFARHQSTPVTEIPAHWPDAYKQVVARRIELIQHHKAINLVERPEYKRRWQLESWNDKRRQALIGWLLDRCEDKSLWYASDGRPRPQTVNSLVERLNADRDFVSVARELAGEDFDIPGVVADILADEHVPFLAQLRYKGEGLVKRAVWEQAWGLQRAEDETGERVDIPVPPKYTSADFQKVSYWRHRGKLDVPKERFISYPGASADRDGSLLIGWSGWDHREQANVLIGLITERTAIDGWGRDRLTPLIAGLAEVMPWVRQWHGDIDPAFGRAPAAVFDEFLDAQRNTYHLTDQALSAWSPPATRRGRPPKTRARDRGFS